MYLPSEIDCPKCEHKAFRLHGVDRLNLEFEYYKCENCDWEKNAAEWSDDHE